MSRTILAAAAILAPLLIPNQAAGEPARAWVCYDPVDFALGKRGASIDLTEGFDGGLG